MKLPANVARCMDALEAAGFACYAVGGCVRDAVLGLTPHDYDLCTAALPAETEAVFADRQLVLAGKSTAPWAWSPATAWWRSPPSAGKGATGTTGTRTGSGSSPT